MTSHTPVVYLAFANALDDHLATLKNESREIYKALQGLQKEGKVFVHREESSQVDELYEDLLAYDQDIVIFHYGGHADGSMLQLEDGGGDAGGLAKLLGQQKSLKLVFLNGCATRDQVQLLHRAGVPTVIATSVKINDTKATIFSTAFYQSLAKGNSIESSFDSAKNLLETKFGGSDIFDIRFNRFPAWDDVEDEGGEDGEDADAIAAPEDLPEQGLEWSLYTRAEAQQDIGQWRLNNAQSEWQVQLRDEKGVIRSAIDDQPLLIEYRALQRTFDASVCSDCGTALVTGGKAALENDVCPVCHSAALKKGAAATALPDRVSPFLSSEKQATKIAQQTLEKVLTGGKKDASLKIEKPVPIWMPYWKFDTSVVANFSGQTALPEGIADGSVKLNWQDSSDTLNADYKNLLVPASRGLLVKDALSERDFDDAHQFVPDDAAQTSLPAEVGIEDAFGLAASGLNQEVEREARDRLGGVDQRNVKTNVRYDKLKAELVWIPKWLVSANFNGQSSPLVIDGQTGDVNLPRVHGQLWDKSGVNRIMNRKTLPIGDEPSRKDLFISVFAGAGIGIMIGLLLGLAAPQAGEDTRSTVSIFIGALGVVLAGLLGLNDRHFSIAKGLRIGSFGIAVSVAALSGIFIRDYGLLTPDNKPSLAYSEAPVIPYASGPQPSVAYMPAPSADPGTQSYLFSSETADSNACSELENPYENEASDAEIINNFKQARDQGWAAIANRVEDGIQPPYRARVLKILRDAECGYGQVQEAFRPDRDSCVALSASVQQKAFHKVAPQLAKFNQGAFIEEFASLPPRDGWVALRLLVARTCSAQLDNRAYDRPDRSVLHHPGPGAQGSADPLTGAE